MKPVRLTENLCLIGAAMICISFFVGCINEPRIGMKTHVNETIPTDPEGFSVEEIGKDLGAVFLRLSFEFWNLIKNKTSQNFRFWEVFCGPTWARTRDHLIMSQSDYDFI